MRSLLSVGGAPGGGVRGPASEPALREARLDGRAGIVESGNGAEDYPVKAPFGKLPRLRSHDTQGRRSGADSPGPGLHRGPRAGERPMLRGAGIPRIREGAGEVRRQRIGRHPRPPNRADSVPRVSEFAGRNGFPLSWE